MNDNLSAFLKVLDPADNSTGGGTASAIAGAMAASLVAMVARLSFGKGGPEADAVLTHVAVLAEQLSLELFDGGREDSAAFEGIRSAYRLAKDTVEQKDTRKQAIQSATIQATRVPLANAERCQRVLGLAQSIKGRSNPNAASDLDCAEYLAQAGLLGCLANVRINLSSIKEATIAAELSDKAERLGRGQHGTA